MSNIHDILSVLQQAAADNARIPQLEAELHTERVRREAAERHSQGLESNILTYKAEIDRLSDKLRSVEAERDDAGFRLLEAEDKLGATVRIFRSVGAEVSDILGILAPAPAPQPAPVPATGQAEASDHDPFEGAGGSLSEPVASPTTPSPSASEAGSTSASSEPASAESHGRQETFMGHEPAPVYRAESGEGHQGSTVSPPEASATPPQPYAGQRYWEVPVNVSWEDFVKGGGIVN